jgi:hypothetical protein
MQKNAAPPPQPVCFLEDDYLNDLIQLNVALIGDLEQAFF